PHGSFRIAALFQRHLQDRPGRGRKSRSHFDRRRRRYRSRRQSRRRSRQDHQYSNGRGRLVGFLEGEEVPGVGAAGGEEVARGRSADGEEISFGLLTLGFRQLGSGEQTSRRWRVAPASRPPLALFGFLWRCQMNRKTGLIPVLLLLAFSAAQAQQPRPTQWKDFDFLLGEWTWSGGGQPGQA